jgi:glucose-6-phosphate 1-epimerase
VRVEGLETLDYLDNMLERSRFTEQGDAITFEGEVHIIVLILLFTGNSSTDQKSQT